MIFSSHVTTTLCVRFKYHSVCVRVCNHNLWLHPVGYRKIDSQISFHPTDFIIRITRFSKDIPSLKFFLGSRANKQTLFFVQISESEPAILIHKSVPIKTLGNHFFSFQVSLSRSRSLWLQSPTSARGDPLRPRRFSRMPSTRHGRVQFGIPLLLLVVGFPAPDLWVSPPSLVCWFGARYRYLIFPGLPTRSFSSPFEARLLSSPSSCPPPFCYKFLWGSRERG